MARMLTRAQRLEDVRAYIMNEDAPNGSSVQDLIAFVNKEMALGVNIKAGRKMTKLEIENERYKAAIVAYLSIIKSATCTDMIQDIPTMQTAMVTDQRVSAICRLMVDEGILDKAMVKGQAFYSLTK